MPDDTASSQRLTLKETKAWHERIARAAALIGQTWPVHCFVSANPLAGLETLGFDQALARMRQETGARVYPSACTYGTAWQRGQIDPHLLHQELQEAGFNDSPEMLLAQMEHTQWGAKAGAAAGYDANSTKVDRLMTKWLAVFLDEGQTEWPMPRREAGFYCAWRRVARYDRRIAKRQLLAQMPGCPFQTIAQLLSGFTDQQQEAIVRKQFIALPGWVSRIKQRVSGDSPWQAIAPITLADYLAVRLTLCRLMEVAVDPDDASAAIEPSASLPLEACWLRAWEKSYSHALIRQLQNQIKRTDAADEESAPPGAQCVFCIDTRSEILRRHLEQSGPYETFALAGFFGIPMRYEGYDTGLTENACPPILTPRHHIKDRAHEAHHERVNRIHAMRRTFRVARRLVNDLKHNVGAAFNFVENSGGPYAVALAVRTLLPRTVRKVANLFDRPFPDDDHICHPDLDGQTASGSESVPAGLSFQQRVQYAQTAFTLMGWQQFAPLVVFLGHRGESANNPFASSLHCGACAGRPGGPNARVIAGICNDPAVREALQQRGITIPEETFVLAGEHNTTTDEVELFTQDLPASHGKALQQLRKDLATAQDNAARERSLSFGVKDSGRHQAEVARRASHWAETRPEWGLAGNSAFIIGSRELTRQMNLAGRCFLHSYDWEQDPRGDALAAILGGPMVVTQWINSHYYFATVDNAMFGSGSKITHDPVGNIGVIQGNGGDLLAGLPLQSIASDDEHLYHQPLRLTVVVHAPVGRVMTILEDQPQLAGLVENRWLMLHVLDPQAQHERIDLSKPREKVAA